MHRVVAILFIVLIAFSACDPRGVYEENLKIPNEGWHMDSMAVFKATIADTSLIYNVLVNIRNTTNYPNSNLYLFITTHAPTGSMLRDTLECYLANNQGEWLGSGFGHYRDNQFPYKRQVKFPIGGQYTFEIQHGMRTSNLEGIVSTGIRIELFAQ